MRELTREYTFEAAHRLEHLGPEHKCSRLHGHTYYVRITITGPIDPSSVWILDYYELDALWEEHIDAKLDHRYLNEIPQLGVTTTENIIEYIKARLGPQLPSGIHLVGVTIREGAHGECSWRVEPSHRNKHLPVMESS